MSTVAIVKRYIPLLITFIIGFVIVLDFFFFGPKTAEHDAVSLLKATVDVIVAPAALIGVVTLIRHHGRILSKRGKGWPFSTIVILAVAFYGLIGIYSALSTTEYKNLVLPNPAFSWYYDNAYAHLDAAIFSLLAFFIASAAYRAFKMRTVEAAVLLVVGSLVMLGRAPIGGAIWPGFTTIQSWLMAVPNTAGFRAILIGVALGAISLALRQLIGVERGYLGPGA